MLRRGFVLLVMGFGCCVVPLPSGFSPSQQQLPAVTGAFVAGFGLLIILIGISFWCTTDDWRRMLAWFALCLTTVSFVAVSGYLSAYFAGQAATGFHRLFGASAFAGLSTSLAIIALIMRSLAIELRLGLCKFECEISAIAFAVPASILSALATGGLASGEFVFVTYLLGLLSISVAIFSQFAATNTLIRTLA